MSVSEGLVCMQSKLQQRNRKQKNTIILADIWCEYKNEAITIAEKNGLFWKKFQYPQIRYLFLKLFFSDAQQYFTEKHKSFFSSVKI